MTFPFQDCGILEKSQLHFVSIPQSRIGNFHAVVHRVLKFVGQRHLAAPGLQCAGMPCGKKLRTQDSGASPLSLPYTLCSLINLLSDLFSLLCSLSSRLSSLMISAFFPLLSSLSALLPLLSPQFISQSAPRTCDFKLCIGPSLASSYYLPTTNY